MALPNQRLEFRALPPFEPRIAALREPARDVGVACQRLLRGHFPPRGLLGESQMRQSFAEERGLPEETEGRDSEIDRRLRGVARREVGFAGSQSPFIVILRPEGRAGYDEKEGHGNCDRTKVGRASGPVEGERCHLRYPSRMSHDSPPLANLLDGASVAASIREGVRAEAAQLGGAGPRLVVLLVGENPASETYVAAKTKAAREAGLRAETVRLRATSSQVEVLSALERANRDADVDGILVQLPLPSGLDAHEVLDSIDPGKDVDGFHPENVGLLHQGRPRFVPCTPAGILALLDTCQLPLSGRRAVVVGRSDIVGKPMAALLTSRDATVTLAHSRTRDLPAICREADLLVVAVGKPGLVTAEWVRPGAVVVDVGMNRLSSLDDAPENLRRCARVRHAIETRGKVLVGDVDFESVAPVAGRITPVPGGVGPLTVAMLLKNTVQAARLRAETGKPPRPVLGAVRN